MNFLNKLIKNVYETVVQDQFYQPITQHEIYSILNRTNKIPPSTTIHNSNKQPQPRNVFELTNSVSEHSPQIQFSMLGYEPTLENISERISSLKEKYNVIDEHMLSHYDEYLKNVNKSLDCYQDGKEFYCTRKKAIELRKVIDKLVRVLNKGKTITRLNIHIKNLKNTLKILDKVPNIKKMNLIELKTINLQKLQKTNQQLQTDYSNKLKCLQNLYKYIVKVNNQSFAYILNNLKMCLDNFEQTLYEQIIRNYIVIHPSTSLQKLIASLLQQKVRSLYDHNIDNPEQLITIAHKIIAMIINLHKIIRWHMINKAIKHKEEEIQCIEKRRLSVDSNNSEEAGIQIELNEIVYLNINVIKEVFSKAIDNCLSQLAVDHILIQDIQYRKLYEYLYLLGKISQLNVSFTGLSMEKLRMLIIEFVNKQEIAIFTKYAKELMVSLDQEKSEWNRLAYNSNYRYKSIDKQLFRLDKLTQDQEFKKIDAVINNMFAGNQTNQTQVATEENIWQLQIIKLPSMEKIDKQFEEWNMPKDYLSYYQGDAILCQSSLKIFHIFQKYINFLFHSPKSKQYSTFISHTLIFIQYYVYYLFNIFLNNSYRQIIFEQTTSNATIQKKYMKKRIQHMYPQLSIFANRFKKILETAQSNNQLFRLYGFFRKEIKEVMGEHQQILRAKTIATESCKYNIAYLHEILVKIYPRNMENNQANKDIWDRFDNTRIALNQLSTMTLTQSSQKMVGLQIQSLKVLFQSIKWSQPYAQLKQYVNKVISIIRQSYQKLKSSNRGEIPLNISHRIFVLIWRTLLTFMIKTFLESKQNNRLENKLNFQKFIDELYTTFQNKQIKQMQQMQTAYLNFKSIFQILLSNNWQQVLSLLMDNMRKFNYIFTIMTNILQNSQHMSTLTQKQKQTKRSEMRQAIEQELTHPQ